MKRPWNIANIPVYSLASYGKNFNVNMNICTYVSAVTLKPKRYMVAVYHHTRSFKNISEGSVAVLQLLGKNHLPLVNTLGKKSGNSYPKQQYLERKKLLTDWAGKKVLAGCAALIELESVWSKNAGDHTIFLFDVRKFVTNHDEVLMLDDLRARKLIRI